MGKFKEKFGALYSAKGKIFFPQTSKVELPDKKSPCQVGMFKNSIMAKIGSKISGNSPFATCMAKMAEKKKSVGRGKKKNFSYIPPGAPLDFVKKKGKKGKGLTRF